MGKKLIIKGADFSVNGIVPPATKIKGVTTSRLKQVVNLIVPSYLTTNISYQIIFSASSLLTTQGARLFYDGAQLTFSEVGYIDGRIIFWNRGKRPDTLFIPTVNTYNNVISTLETTTINGEVFANSIGEQQSDVSIEGKISLYDSRTVYPAGSLIFQEFKVINPDNGNVIVDYFAAKDKNNKACFWDILSDTLCYADDGDLVAVTD